MEMTYFTVIGFPSVRPTPSMVKLQSCSCSGNGFSKVRFAVTGWFTVASPISCTEEFMFYHVRGGIL